LRVAEVGVASFINQLEKKEKISTEEARNVPENRNTGIGLNGSVKMGIVAGSKWSAPPKVLYAPK